MHPPPLMSMFLGPEDWSKGLSIATFVKSFLSRTLVHRTMFDGAGPLRASASLRCGPSPDIIGMHAIREADVTEPPVHAQTIHFMAVDRTYAASAPLGWAGSERCAPQTSPWPSAICGWQVISDSGGNRIPQHCYGQVGKPVKSLRKGPIVLKSSAVVLIGQAIRPRLKHDSFSEGLPFPSPH
jgi:hypothetical protein